MQTWHDLSLTDFGINYAVSNLAWLKLSNHSHVAKPEHFLNWQTEQPSRLRSNQVNLASASERSSSRADARTRLIHRAAAPRRMTLISLGTRPAEQHKSDHPQPKKTFHNFWLSVRRGTHYSFT